MVFLSYFFWISVYKYISADIPPAYDDPIIMPGFEYFANIFLWAFAVFITLGLFIAEVLIRYYITHKYHYFKLNLNIKIPKFFDILYSVIFITGICLSILPVLFVTLVFLKSIFI